MISSVSAFSFSVISRHLISDEPDAVILTLSLSLSFSFSLFLLCSFDQTITTALRLLSHMSL